MKKYFSNTIYYILVNNFREKIKKNVTIYIDK